MRLNDTARHLGIAAAVTLLATPAFGHAQTTLRYQYDALGRLVEVATRYEVQTTYAFDAAGNRTQVARPEINSYASQIYRLYDIAAGRPPTAQELGVWLPHFETGGTLEAAATNILTDSGIQQRWGMPISDTAYITAMYQYAFRRSPTSAEVGTWLNLLSTSHTRGSMLAVFVQHADHRAFTDGPMVHGLEVYTTDVNSYAAKIYRLYHLMLGRAPLAGEIHDWIKGCLGAGLPLDNCAGGFLADSTVQARWSMPLSDTDFVQKVYLYGFGRAADPGEVAYWTSCLANGWTRQSVAAFFSEYPDHRAFTDPLIISGLTYVC